MNYETVVERCLSRVGKHIVLGLPLGLGKPNELVNAFCRRARAEPEIRLDIVTALSLDVPQPRRDLERRLMEPIIARLFGENYPRLDYLAQPLPDNIRLTEFYFQSGKMLGNADAQRRYVSSNYTHVARDLIDRGVNVVAQLVAHDAELGYSLSCNPDVTLDLAHRLKEHPEHDCMVIGQVHPDLPFMHGDAVVGEDFFDEILTLTPRQPLFALPRTPISVQDYWVGLNASRLMADGGTLQVGIGSLSDALVHALILRHRDNAAYRKIFDDTAGYAIGGLATFEQGLYGASEMFMDGFMHLYRAGILKREVFDDIDLQRRANAGESLPEAGTGAVMDGGFFLGSRDFYEFLNSLDASERPRFRMHGVGRINQLYGGSEELEIEQRRGARFINTCMMMTLTGSAVSDGLKDHQVVSGVGGQYNFVAMAHAMDDGRSILMLRGVRESGGETVSNIVWEYPHCTIPRHLRDIVVTEYGVANLRGKTDEECVQALLRITDSRFQRELMETAKRKGKLKSDWQLPDEARNNTPERLEARLQAAGGRTLFPDYPFGCDFTEIEQHLIPALQKLKGLARSKPAVLNAILRGRPADFPDELTRLGLKQPSGWRERVQARLVAFALDVSTGI